jgi:hypothetical protein
VCQAGVVLRGQSTRLKDRRGSFILWFGGIIFAALTANYILAADVLGLGVELGWLCNPLLTVVMVGGLSLGTRWADTPTN